VLTEVQREGGRVTLATLADLVRGLGGGSFAVATGKGRKRKVTNEKMSVDLVGIAGGKVELNKEVRFTAPTAYSQTDETISQDTESLLIHLTLLGYVEECT
jgi:ATP-dependent DNA helicase Q1